VLQHALLFVLAESETPCDDFHDAVRRRVEFLAGGNAQFVTRFARSASFIAAATVSTTLSHRARSLARRVSSR
jgi:phosphoserine phosphatase